MIAAMVAPSRGQEIADAGGVVVLADQDQVADGGRDAGRCGDRRRHIARVVGREVVAPGDIVVPAVIVALELQDPLPTGEPPGEPDRVECRLGAGAAEDDSLGGRDHPDEPLGQLHFERVGGREGDAVIVHRPDDRRPDAAVVVAEQDGTEGVVEVDVLVAVDVPDPRALGSLHVERIRRGAAPFALDATRRDGVGTLEQLAGRGRRHRPAEVRRVVAGGFVDLERAHGRTPFSRSIPAGSVTVIRSPVSAAR